ncbi:hypothetical protein [Altibacter sp. HG106]|uniref:hypothetical protein n=1 Tax=Altibacter sp. HG106 TaxID=3023937 RepID=UPI0023509182|nr:hypothetical protein [Altibacter sp. HG106]MDC7994530.1 hypothetical protein [Altibacter sp. HG106]
MKQLFLLSFFLLIGVTTVFAQEETKNTGISKGLLTLESLVTAQHPVGVAKSEANFLPKKKQHDPTAQTVNGKLQLSNDKGGKNAFLFVVEDSKKKMVQPTPKKTDTIKNGQVSALKAALGIDN